VEKGATAEEEFGSDKLLQRILEEKSKSNEEVGEGCMGVPGCEAGDQCPWRCS